MGVAKSMTLRGGEGGPTLSVTMTLIFPKIVWTCPLTFTVTIFAVRLIGNRPHFRTIWEELYA